MAAVKECCCLSWAVIKIGCFTVRPSHATTLLCRLAAILPGMHLATAHANPSSNAFWQCCRRLAGAQPPNQRPEFDIICLGLHEAGKSSLLALVSNEDTDELLPTGGFAIKAVALSNVVFSVKEVGGVCP